MPLPATGWLTRATVSTTTGFGLTAYAFVVVMLGTTLPTSLYPIYQQHMGFSQLVITVIFASYAAGVIAGLLIFGGLSDQIGRRRVLLPGIGLSAASSVVFLLAQGLPILLLGRVLSGLSAGIFTGTATAMLVDLVPAQRRTAAGLGAAAANMGGLGLGPLVSGALAELATAPLRLPYLVHFILLVPAACGIALAPEPVDTTGRTRPRLQRLRVPAAVRPTFTRAVIVGFAGFSVLGLFTAVSPAFLRQVLHETNYAFVGVVVFSLLAASTAGQVGSAGLPRRAALLTGCLVLAVGVTVIATSLLVRSLPLLLAGALIAGAGQGAGFRAGLTAVNSATPVEHRGEVSSSFFTVTYVALSGPVIGVGALSERWGLVSAGVIFACVVIVLALTAAGLLLRRTDTA